MAVMTTVTEYQPDDGEYRSRRYSTPGLNAAHPPPRTESTGDIHDVGLYHDFT